jgi:hypothetical protein
LSAQQERNEEGRGEEDEGMRKMDDSNGELPKVADFGIGTSFWGMTFVSGQRRL